MSYPSVHGHTKWMCVPTQREAERKRKGGRDKGRKERKERGTERK